MRNKVDINKVRISVIIPTYKPGNYIYQCLESLERQTLDEGKFEIIIILNGCADPWKTYIKKLIESKFHFTNIRFIQTDIAGVSNARNIGIELAVGQYIAFIDDDDYVSNLYLEKLLDKQDGESLVLSNSIAFEDETNEFDRLYPMRKAYYKLKQKKDISLFQSRPILNGPCMKLIPVNLIKDIRFDLSFINGEDSLFMFEISKNVKKICLASDEAIYFRRNRSNSAVTRKKPTKIILLNAVKLISQVAVRYLKHPISYNLPFTISRLLAPIKGALYEIFRSK